MHMGESYPEDITLTSFGRLEVERWIEDGQATELIAISPSQVFNTHFHGNVTGSPVIVGSTDTTVNMQTAVGEQLSDLISKARLLFEAWQGEGDEREDVEADIEILAGEVAKPSDGPGRIKAALRRIARWAATTAGAAATAELSGEVQDITHELMRAIT